MREQQRRVVQKLAYARWHLAWCETAANSRPQVDALLESSIIHAVDAYRAFLAEVLQDTHIVGLVSAGSFANAADLVALCKDYVPPSLGECHGLEQQDGWLRQLLDWHQACQRTSEGLANPQSSQLVVSASAEQPPTPEAVGNCIAELDALIDRLRGDMLEY